MAFRLPQQAGIVGGFAVRIIRGESVASASRVGCRIKSNGKAKAAMATNKDSVRWVHSSTNTHNGNDDSHPLTATKERTQQDHNYCVDMVRDRDREGYLCGLLMPKSAQKAYFALQAFNVELASIKDGSARLRGGADNSSIALQLKFQRWKDLIHEIYNDNNNMSTNNSNKSSGGGILPFAADPVAASLTRAVHDKELTRRFLERLIEAREGDVEVVQLNTIQELTRYAEESVSSRLYLTLECLGCRDDNADIVASHAGVGIGVVTNLRGAPFRIAMGEIPIPVELLPPSFPYGMLQDLALEPDTAWPDAQDEQDWNDAIHQMAMVASGHLMKAQELQGQIPKAARSCLLPMVPAMHYLSKLQAAPVNYNVFHPHLRGGGDRWDRLRVLLYLSRSWLTGVY